MDRFRNKLVSFQLAVTNTLAWTNTIAYYKIWGRIHNTLFIGPNKLEHFITIHWKGLPVTNTLAYCADM